ncbi:MAG: hypothetical protein KDI31_18180, partial [Pseudomonadales bacterium]|nr:hypothetical protein [Pseudomonadales bacterium]
KALGKDAVILEQIREQGLIRVTASRDYPEATTGAATGVTPGAYTQRLKQLGFEERFIRELPGGVQNWQQLSNVVLNRIALTDTRATASGRIRLVGAPGVGKTTMIIKLMAEQVLRHGPASGTLISTDTHRLAGCEQLALAAELLGVRFIESPPEDLQERLAAEAEGKLVLIDTAGVSFGQPQLPVAGCDDVLVIAATWQPGALRRNWLQLDKQRLAGVAISQIDQAETLGAVLSVVSDWQLPLRWLSRGPELYDDLEVATGKALAEIVLQGIDRSEMSTMFA